MGPVNLRAELEADEAEAALRGVAGFQAVGADAVDHALRVVGAHAVIQLHRADVGEEHDARCDLAHPIGREQPNVFERGALTAQAQGHAGPFGRDGQVEVDRAGALGAAGHR